MRRFHIIPAVLAISALSLSCSKEKFNSFNDSFSYKTSGTVTMIDTEYAEATEEEKKQFEVDGVVFEPVELSIVPEEGQLRLIDKGDGQIYISFNTFLGNGILAEATLDGRDITFSDGQDRTVEFENDILKTKKCRLAWNGKGKIYDNAIVFDLAFYGKTVYDGKDMTVTESRLECVAIKND